MAPTTVGGSEPVRDSSAAIFGLQLAGPEPSGFNRSKIVTDQALYDISVNLRYWLAGSKVMSNSRCFTKKVEQSWSKLKQPIVRK